MPTITIKTASLEQYLEKGGGKYRVLLFGTPGSGKTPWAAQWPKPLFLMADRNGPDSLVITKSPYVEVRSEKDINDALDWLQLESMRPSFPYETIVIDTYSVLQAHIIQGILRREGKKNLDGFGNWGELSATMKAILDKAHNINAHLIVLCHLKDKFDSDTGEFEPDLVGGAKTELPKEFPYIGWLYSDWDVVDDQRTVVRRIRWQATPRCPWLRSASGVLPAETPVTFTPKDFEVIRDAIAGGAAAIGAKATVTEVADSDEPKAAPPDVQGGPVAEVKAPAKKTSSRAKKPATSKAPEVQAPAEPPEPAGDAAPDTPDAAAQIAREAAEHDAAVQTVTETLGAESVDPEGDELMRGVFACGSMEGLRAYYLAHKSDPGWTAEHTQQVSTLKAAFAGKA